MIPTSTAPRRDALRDPVLWFAFAMVGTWALLGAVLNPGQQGDHLEQFTWAHSMEWGYHKHPPLPTWLLGLAIRVLGVTPDTPHVVAALLTCGTAVFTYLVARELLGRRLAPITILLWGLHWAFSWKAQLLNHNTVMMCCIAAAAWCALQAVKRPRAWGWWAALGAVGGLALLSKYQSAVPLVGIVIALAWAGHLKQGAHRLGLALAVAIALLVFAPHVVWMVQHDFITLKYASTSVHQLTPFGRVRKLVTFTALQLRMLISVLLCIAVLALWARNDAPAEPQDEDGASAAEQRAWLFGLLGWPLIVLAILCLFQGVRLQDHWGFQTVQFVSLWFTLRLGRLAGPHALRRLVLLAFAAHLIGMAVYSRPTWDPRALLRRDRPDQWYPAQKLADAVMRDWRRETACPLRYVVGQSYEAGMVSLYSGRYPVVLEGGLKERSPWVDLADLERSGAVYVYSQPPEQTPGPGPLHKQAFRIKPEGHSLYDVYWAVVPPQQNCPAP